MKTSPEYDLSSATWHKSSYSDGSGGDCLEVADGHPGIVPVRDSKNPNGPRLELRAESWSAFLLGVKNGQLTGP
ncbi:DUF397 domain-containing protein [Streptomyces sp. ISL-100]|uniref:DUF397 domain-containing protein n=1 Tax=Streptomyces sp. ISL-100 TaxID=2819173 RepID=UPI001BE76206|nr:DUF397 domain-containing protein [Streptomyces sp. ISL-100]MBT2398488.1 DUF397 domain-containing protein [Streptomyces sp. ISL-100]